MSSPFKDRKVPQKITDEIKLYMYNFLSDSSAIDAILLCSTDGFELASVHKQKEFPAEKIATVSSSIIAMVTALLAEIKLKGCNSITLESSNGKGIINLVNVAHYSLIIVVITNQKLILGVFLSQLKNFTTSISLIDYLN